MVDKHAIDVLFSRTYFNKLILAILSHKLLAPANHSRLVDKKKKENNFANTILNFVDMKHVKNYLRGRSGNKK